MVDNIKKIIYSMHPLEREVLKESNLSETEKNTGLQLLEQKGLVQVERVDEVFIGLDKYGKKYVDDDLPEIKLLKELINSEKKLSQIKLDKSEVSSAMGILKRHNLIDIRKEDEQILRARDSAKELINNFKNPLKEFKEDIIKSDMSNSQKSVYEEFKRRPGFIREFSKKSISFKLTKEANKIAKELKDKYKNLTLIETLNSDMLKSGYWRDKEFRHYDINVPTNYDNIGRHHPMIESNNILRDIFVEMGFKEMVGPIVESAFWNMDTMWIPQDHPARDEQDTFYLEGESSVPSDLIKKVKNMHENGLKRGHTPEGEWSEIVSKKKLLRTHSTATSFRTLYELGKKRKKGEDINGKHFYIAHNFRNETIDATHLAEFFQGEGFIVGDDLSLADLMGFIKDFYAKLGIYKIKFKPTFNPYTEPSMEAHYYDPKMKKWYSLINSGIFRQETLEPLGLYGKTVIAWGMGASRVAALLARKDSMRDITGVTCDLEWLKNRPMMQRRIVR